MSSSRETVMLLEDVIEVAVMIIEGCCDVVVSPSRWL